MLAERRDVELSSESENELVAAMRTLPPHPEVSDALRNLAATPLTVWSRCPTRHWMSRKHNWSMPAFASISTRCIPRIRCALKPAKAPYLAVRINARSSCPRYSWSPHTLGHHGRVGSEMPCRLRHLQRCRAEPGRRVARHHGARPPQWHTRSSEPILVEMAAAPAVFVAPAALGNVPAPTPAVRVPRPRRG